MQEKGKMKVRHELGVIATDSLHNASDDVFYWLEKDSTTDKVYLWCGRFPDKSTYPCKGIPVRDLIDCWSGYEKVINRRVTEA